MLHNENLSQDTNIIGEYKTPSYKYQSMNKKYKEDTTKSVNSIIHLSSLEKQRMQKSLTQAEQIQQQ